MMGRVRGVLGADGGNRTHGLPVASMADQALKSLRASSMTEWRFKAKRRAIITVAKMTLAHARAGWDIAPASMNPNGRPPKRAS